ncbi:Rpn family recombination-promoting nuclease/putative transposase [Synechocystis sp. LEGE 06083]|uniref:Rpn family recombination-promoting nuclease/putative transposase n=1 Tax=Synechocystis sp. LEGE 06083 TaxID=915336 RepID=UPI001881F9E4|nr:Rpn family recombination-promoting nuclease/putative transposase [Synechocystis sp. LEGE 06083]MBE9196974.1 Rpn family recombination-promoting nuclease/putative transposase [Synechocystis sp. LEGE 06083]
MFDNLCKFLAESFSEDYAAWLLGRPIKLTKLSPTELSLEPIRADSLILEQSEDLVLHLEFQTEPDSTMGFRMLDYRVRVYRRFPQKTMHQFVIYLKPSNNDLVYQDSFQLGETLHRYQAIRLWEQSSEVFLQSPGLLPLAVLTQTSDPALKLREVATTVLDQIEDNRVKANLMAATSVFGGILLAPELIKTILRSEIMKESAIYQEILEEGKIAGKLEGRLEGKLEGRLEAKLETIPLLKKLGLTIAEIAKELDIDVELVNRFVANQNN